MRRRHEALLYKDPWIAETKVVLRKKTLSNLKGTHCLPKHSSRYPTVSDGNDFSSKPVNRFKFKKRCCKRFLIFDDILSLSVKHLKQSKYTTRQTNHRILLGRFHLPNTLRLRSSALSSKSYSFVRACTITPTNEKCGQSNSRT
jgi:hypothetical protein